MLVQPRPWCWWFLGVLLAVSTPVWAAPADEEGGRSAKGGPARMGAGRAGEGFLLLLLRMERVQKELNLTDEQKGKLKDLLGEGTRPRDGKGRGDNPPEGAKGHGDGFRAQMGEQLKKVHEVLQPEQLTRLKEIGLQVRGAAVLLDQDMTDKLKLTDQQKEKLRLAYDEASQKRRTLRPDQLRDLSADERRQKMAEFAKQHQQIDDDFRRKAEDILTTDQLKEFQKMLGQKVDLGRDALRFGFGRGPGGALDGKGKGRREP